MLCIACTFSISWLAVTATIITTIDVFRVMKTQISTINDITFNAVVDGYVKLLKYRLETHWCAVLWLCVCMCLNRITFLIYGFSTLNIFHHASQTFWLVQLIKLQIDRKMRFKMRRKRSKMGTHSIFESHKMNQFSQNWNTSTFDGSIEWMVTLQSPTATFFSSTKLFCCCCCCWICVYSKCQLR